MKTTSRTGKQPFPVQVANLRFQSFEIPLACYSPNVINNAELVLLLPPVLHNVDLFLLLKNETTCWLMIFSFACNRFETFCF